MTGQPERPPTVLESELRRRRWSREYAVREMMRAASDIGVPGGGISLRQLDRWLSGNVRIPRGAACRVAEHVFGMPIETLLGPAKPTPVAGIQTDPPLAPTTVAEFVAQSAETSRDHAALAAAGGVAEATLEQLHAEVQRLAHAYASAPPLTLLAQLMRTRDLAYQLLGRTRRPGQVAELYLIAGQVCGLAATTTFDIGNRDAAEDHGRAAWTYADLIDHAALRSYARSVQATIAFWSGKPSEGLRYVDSGLRYAAGPAAVRLHAIGARAFALLPGREIEAREALRSATEIADRNEPGNEMTDEIGGEFAFGRPRFALCAGAVHVTLGDGRGGAHWAREALRLYQESTVEERRWAVECGAMMNLATARALQDNLDGAVEALGPALTLEPQRRTARLAQRLTTLRTAVRQSRYRGSSTARTVAGAIDDFTVESLVHSGRLALPAGS